jgi:hypothetical protein
MTKCYTPCSQEQLRNTDAVLVSRGVSVGLPRACGVELCRVAIDKIGTGQEAGLPGNLNQCIANLFTEIYTLIPSV